MKLVKVQHFRMKTIQKSVFGIPGKKLKNGCGVLFLFLGILSFFVCLFQAFGQDIWFDEVFSVNFIQHSYKEIAALTGKDVHPPLYYWYLKLFHDIGKVLVPAASSIVLCKLASMLPFVGIFVYTLTAIRKNFGLHVAGLFWFLIMPMPQMMIIAEVCGSRYSRPMYSASSRPYGCTMVLTLRTLFGSRATQ